MFVFISAGVTLLALILAALEGCEHLHILKIRFSPKLPGAGVIPPRFLDNLDLKSLANTTSLSPKIPSLTSGKNSKSVPGAPKKSPKVRSRKSEKTPKTLPRLSEKSPTKIDDMDEEMEFPITPEASDDEEPPKWDVSFQNSFVTVKHIYRELTSNPPSTSLSGKVLKHMNFPFLALFMADQP